MSENLKQYSLVCFVQLSIAVVASFNAITASVFHVGTSVTMTMTVGTRVMSRTAVSTSMLLEWHAWLGIKVHLYLHFCDGLSLQRTLHAEELISLAPVVAVYIKSGCVMERMTVETMLMSEAVVGDSLERKTMPVFECLILSIILEICVISTYLKSNITILAFFFKSPNTVPSKHVV